MKRIFTLLIGAGLLSSINTYAQTSIWKEDFESVTVPALPNNWSQQTAATTGWKTHSGAISFPQGLDPFPAHTTYAVVDDWNNNEDNDTTILVSPYIDLSGKTGTYLKFEYFFHQAQYNSGSPKETAYVLGSLDSGKNWTVLDTIKGSSEWSLKHVSLAAYDNTSDVLIGFKYNDGSHKTNKLFGLAVDDVEIFIPLADDIALTDITPVAGGLKSYAEKGKTKTLGGTVYNNGASTITTFTVHYQEGSSPIVSDIISGVSIKPFTSYDFTNTTALAVPSGLGNHPIEMWVEFTGDLNATNDSANTTIVATDFIPNKKILVEEATGTWCGWCPRGTVYMDSLHNTYPNSFSLVAVHNNDPMEDNAYDNFMGGFLSAAGTGYPSVVIDRRDVLDPSDLIDVYNEQRDNFGFASITLESPDAPSFDIIVKAHVKPAIDLSGDYRLVLIVTENDVEGQGSSWEQENYYNNYIPLTGAGINWFTAGSKVANLKYDFVGRMVSPSPSGAAGSLPATMTAGTTYDYTFQTTVRADYKRSNMHAVVALIRNSDGQILNSNTTTVTTGISNIDAGINKVAVYPNPASGNAFVNFTLKENSNVTVNVTDALGRIVSSIPSQDMTAGTHKLNINLSGVPSGLYNVTVRTERGAVTERLSIINN